MNILCIGDIVGKPGRKAVAQLIPVLKQEHNIELVVANAENAAGGIGITPRIAQELFDCGCDVLTAGDHIWDKNEIKELLDTSTNIVRPANFAEGAPGTGTCTIKTNSGHTVGVVNLLGRVFMRYYVECPFRTLQNIVAALQGKTRIIIVDFHAEATSEKIALGLFIDGKVSAVMGSHTHVQTADDKVLPKGTAYITDLGMTGPHDSVIGQNKEQIIQRFLSGIPIRFQVAADDVRLNGAVIDIDEITGKARTITRIQRRSFP